MDKTVVTTIVDEGYRSVLAGSIYATLGADERQLIYALLAAVLTVALDWLRQKLTGGR
jgi:hypothetical protein